MAKTSGGVRNTRPPSKSDIAREKILKVLNDIAEKGYSMEKPFEVGKVEERMLNFAAHNGIELGSNDIYMTSAGIAHAMRDSKTAKGLAVSGKELSEFPAKMRGMALYYDSRTGNFTYTNGKVKYIIHPNYEIKVGRKKKKTVNFITASKINSEQEFVMQKYIKIEDS